MLANFGLLPILISCILACLALSLLTAACNRWGTGLNHIKGPPLAGFTNFWRLALVLRSSRPELEHIALHGKYGSLVRLGPKMVAISDPDAIKLIYGLNAGYVKAGAPGSKFYTVPVATTREGKPLYEMFSTQDEKYHAKLRRVAANAYSLSSLVHFEPLVDSTTTVFLDQLSRRYADRSDDSGLCDFGTWLQYYAFDVIGELTFSKRLGFLERGIDVDRIIGDMQWFNNYSSAVGQVPWLDRLLLKNPLLLLCSRMGWIDATSPVLRFAKAGMGERERVDGAATHQQKVAQRRDFLAHFLSAGDKNPQFLTSELVLTLTAANVFAGSDTTAISLRAILYYLLRHPETLERLRSETDGLHGMEDKRLVSWSEVHELPYLSAVIKEALRCHPAVGLPLERLVPKPGVEVCGAFLRAGTVVGINAWVVHQSEEIFGANPSSFVPERWLDVSADKLTRMNNCLFAFGSGARTCIGKNISYLEMYKVVPALLRTFEISLANPSEEWKIHSAWFVKQASFHTRLRTRERK